jgi:hypothetical protein
MLVGLPFLASPLLAIAAAASWLLTPGLRLDVRNVLFGGGLVLELFSAGCVAVWVTGLMLGASGSDFLWMLQPGFLASTAAFLLSLSARNRWGLLLTGAATVSEIFWIGAAAGV